LGWGLAGIFIRLEIHPIFLPALSNSPKKQICHQNTANKEADSRYPARNSQLQGTADAVTAGAAIRPTGTEPKENTPYYRSN
jgi:hypothetical protein